MKTSSLGEGQERQLRRPGDADLEPVRGGLVAQARQQPLARAAHRLDAVARPQLLERGERAGHRRRRHPERAGGEDPPRRPRAASRRPAAPRADGRWRATCSTRSGRAARRAAPSCRPGRSASPQRTSSSSSAAPIRSHSARSAAGELGIGELEVAVDVVPDRRDDDRGDVVSPASATAASRRREVVVVVEDRVGVVVGGGPARAGGIDQAPIAVVGAAGDAAPCGRPVGARATVRPSVVASVPFLQNIAQSAWATWSTIVSASSTMRGLGPLRTSPSASCAATAASTGGMAVAEQDRPPRAHQVDVLGAVDVPHAAARAAGEELREVSGHEAAC